MERLQKMKSTCPTLIKFSLYVYGVYVYRLEMFDKAGSYAQRFFHNSREKHIN